MKHGSDERRLGGKCFSNEDQILFASISRDRNPMHMDPIAARRLLSGRQVVHGIHTLLTAIELWQNDSASSPSRIQCDFFDPVSVGDQVEFTQTGNDIGGYAIRASVDGQRCMEVAIHTTAGRVSEEKNSPEDRNCESFVGPAAGWLDVPNDANPETLVGRTWAIDVSLVDAKGVFPITSAYLGEARVGALATLSYFVGMVCPGLHSIFASLTVDLERPSQESNCIVFRCERYDARFRVFTVAFRGCISGSLKAFLRPPPQKQPSFEEISRLVGPGEFQGTTSLVIGGSRGLGELTARILAAGGGDVTITYASGREDAMRICADIEATGTGRCDAVEHDVGGGEDFSLDVEVDSLHAVYYYATPRIFEKHASLFDPRRFTRFVDFYIVEFIRLCRWLDARKAGREIRVYFPSTVYIAERPKGMTEYAMAKAAAEVLIDDMNKALGHVSIVRTRLPRLATDQTASLTRVATDSNLETLLPIVRAMYC